MARGDVATIEPTELPKGRVVTTSGRISGSPSPEKFPCTTRFRSKISSSSTTR